MWYCTCISPTCPCSNVSVFCFFFHYSRSHINTFGGFCSHICPLLPRLWCAHLFSSPASRCWVVMFISLPPLPSFFLSFFLYVSVCACLSIAAGSIREEAITAAHKGTGWRNKKKCTRQTAPIPSELSTLIFSPSSTSGVFLNRQTVSGKLLPLEDTDVSISSE